MINSTVSRSDTYRSGSRAKARHTRRRDSASVSVDFACGKTRSHSSVIRVSQGITGASRSGRVPPWIQLNARASARRWRSRMLRAKKFIRCRGCRFARH
jgi:hypothetical protein